jgi:phospholipid/cholesterol/gamma-HCH transport system substrate-binding protein
MKFSKEIRIGLLVTASLFAFVAGFYFLKGANLFSGENNYYAYYDNVQGLLASASVQVKGLSVGRVANIKLNPDGKVKVELAVSKKIKVTKGTIAKLMSSDLLGTKVISLDIGQSTELLEDEATIPGVLEGGLLDNLSAEISPLILDIRHVVATLDTVLVGVTGILSPQTRQNLSNSVASLDVTMRNFSELAKKLNGESDHLAGIVRNVSSVTGNLAKNNQQITNIMKNMDNISGQLAGAPIAQAFKDLQSAASQLQGVINKINANQGSLGMLVNDKVLYSNLSESLKTLDALMADIKAHPSRYINVTIFGKKKGEAH